MSEITRSIKVKWENSVLHRVYDMKDDRGKGRFCWMLSGILSNVAGQMTGGLFLTSFLLLYDLDKSRIGILIFIPYMASMLNIFSPALLEKFKRRRGLLIGMKLSYYIINILGITLLPELIQGSQGRIIGFIVLTIAANVVNQLASSGWAAWQASFLPDNVRVDYFQLTNAIQNAFIWVIALGVSVLGDMVSGTEHELLMLTIVRYVAFIVAIVDCGIWLIPKEFPYVKKARPKISNVFVLPIKNKPFFLTMVVLAVYNFAVQLPNATINAYLLEDVGVNYSLVSGINATYFIFCFVLSPLWKRFVNKHYWYRAYGFEMMMEAVTFLMYAFVTSKTIWLYVVVRLSQHVLGVLLGTISGPIFYEVLPEEDQMSYLSFNTLFINGSIFVSMMLGTALAAIMGDSVIMGFTSTQICLLGSGVILFADCIFAFWLGKKLGRKAKAYD